MSKFHSESPSIASSLNKHVLSHFKYIPDTLLIYFDVNLCKPIIFIPSFLINPDVNERIGRSCNFGGIGSALIYN